MECHRSMYSYSNRMLGAMVKYKWKSKRKGFTKWVLLVTLILPLSSEVAYIHLDILTSIYVMFLNIYN